MTFYRPILSMIVFTASVLLAQPGIATTLTVGESIPELTIREHGELLIEKGSPAFKPWSTASLSDGKRMHVLMYIAPTLGASRLNKSFTDTLDQQGFDFDRVLPTSIINVSQAPWGAAGIVMRELTHNKRKYPQSILVADTLGLGLGTWALKPDSYAVVILDPDGRILFFKDGALNHDEITEVMQILHAGVAGASQPEEGTAP